MLLKGAISSNNNPQGHDDGGHPDNEVHQGINAATMRVSGLEKMC